MNAKGVWNEAAKANRGKILIFPFAHSSERFCPSQLNRFEKPEGEMSRLIYLHFTVSIAITVQGSRRKNITGEYIN
jgi:hypothetical protein